MTTREGPLQWHQRLIAIAYQLVLEAIDLSKVVYSRDTGKKRLKLWREIKRRAKEYVWRAKEYVWRKRKKE